ncbi:hypothetical protein HYH03_011263 [Edaphochlamys debaryana]|uniref:Uncharacterized protein n=1 Tax=Edaphochlamys debaryana TaxID=47281 RepID=A0A835XVE4_9CHLO|nr:hypothetical protein HYH03_011263 [Edaphochlamys debaryana]|eukprot:KAG2490312.1 hypothetical protein HYH03_011263 [Edaphochlamys debaryana]
MEDDGQPAPLMPPPMYGPYGAQPPPYYGGYGAYPPPPYGGYGGYGGYGSSPEPSPALPPVPACTGRWATMYDYLKEVVIVEIWPFFDMAMSPNFRAAVQNPTARFTLFMPLIEYMYNDALVKSILANPYDPAALPALGRLMDWHMALGVTGDDNTPDGFTMTNMLGGTLRLQSRITEEDDLTDPSDPKKKDVQSWWVNGVQIASRQCAGQGMGHWLKGVLHETDPAPGTA